MTVCPIAIVAGCEKCPVFKLCPLKSLLGDKPPPPPISVEPPKSRRKPDVKKP